jgi:hypothetical protein
VCDDKMVVETAESCMRKQCSEPMLDVCMEVVPEHKPTYYLRSSLESKAHCWEQMAASTRR